MQPVQAVALGGTGRGIVGMGRGQGEREAEVQAFHECGGTEILGAVARLREPVWKDAGPRASARLGASRGFDKNCRQSESASVRNHPQKRVHPPVTEAAKRGAV